MTHEQREAEYRRITKILLRRTQSEQQWNEIVSIIEHHDPYYFTNWWADEVLASGLAYEVEQSWKRAE